MKYPQVNKDTLNSIADITDIPLTNYQKCRLCAFHQQSIREAHRLYKLALEFKVIDSPIDYLVSRAKEHSFLANITPDYNLAKQLMKHYKPPAQEKENMYEPHDEAVPLRNRIWIGNSYEPATPKDWSDRKGISEHLDGEASRKLKKQGIDIEAFMQACGSKANS